MKKHFKDIAKIVLYSSLFSILISFFPQITLEGAFVFMGGFLFITSVFAASAYKARDRRSFKFIANERNQKRFKDQEHDQGHDQNFDQNQKQISQKKSEEAFKKMVISGIILFAFSYFAFYL
ncbi:hypothetical protein [Fusibacter ferrireducens]|uniref:DUF3899 domain-containing protein n=1 Tax=Fusibacter ferrireducens TaxID=2785058 RepID=A0ABS0A0H7_9FIRM|nr:hypothetical protein [Fusibacter ferrireducens]MBF4695943.1 hypothetical protein [Fusibacter ferrireducens]